MEKERTLYLRTLLFLCFMVGDIFYFYMRYTPRGRFTPLGRSQARYSVTSFLTV